MYKTPVRCGRIREFRQQIFYFYPGFSATFLMRISLGPSPTSLNCQRKERQ